MQYRTKRSGSNDRNIWEWFFSTTLSLLLKRKIKNIFASMSNFITQQKNMEIGKERQHLTIIDRVHRLDEVYSVGDHRTIIWYICWRRSWCLERHESERSINIECSLDIWVSSYFHINKWLQDINHKRKVEQDGNPTIPWDILEMHV